MADTRLILHVKGTEAETTELPKTAIRAAVSQGKITYSQLIWSTAHGAWKQVREWPELLPADPLILHVKGTEAEFRQLPRQDVRVAISQGQLSHSQLIWSPEDNAWKQVRELPELLPSQKLAPAPTKIMPRVADEVITESPASPVARAAGAATAQPQVRTPVAFAGSSTPTISSSPAGVPQARVASVSVQQAPQAKAVAVSAAQMPRMSAGAPVSSDPHVHQEDSSHPLKWLCILLGGAIVLVWILNYVLVDQPLVSRFSQSPYSGIAVYAHFGAFVQPSVMVVHIPPTTKITSDNFADVLVALARSTPSNPISHDPFERIALSSGWTAQYSFSGTGWRQLGEEDQESEAQRKEFLLRQIDDAAGEPLLPESTLNPDAQQVKRDQLWNTLISTFTPKQ